jgi:hypothetical protein
LIKEEGDMSKNKGRRDISPGKKPGPLTKKERKERKKFYIQLSKLIT